MKKRMVLLVTLVMMVSMLLSGCRLFESEVNSLKGKLKGVSYTAEFYDNYGAKFLNVSGQNIDIEGNKVKEIGFDSEGSTITQYSLSSVITITIDGKEMSSCGNTVIFAESGLQRDVDFSLTDINSESKGNVTDLTSVAKVVNKYKNYFGKPRVVVIQSQLGVPICAYSGEEVYQEIPKDLPKMTKLMIDGKALYIHRANFEIIDRELIQ